MQHLKKTPSQTGILGVRGRIIKNFPEEGKWVWGREGQVCGPAERKRRDLVAVT